MVFKSCYGDVGMTVASLLEFAALPPGKLGVARAPALQSCEISLGVPHSERQRVAISTKRWLRRWILQAFLLQGLRDNLDYLVARNRSKYNVTVSASRGSACSTIISSK